MALLFITGVFAGAAGGVFVFFMWKHEFSPHMLRACRVFNYPAPFCVSRVAKMTFFGSKYPPALSTRDHIILVSLTSLWVFKICFMRSGLNA